MAPAAYESINIDCGKFFEEKTYTTGSQVTGHPLSISILVLLEVEHRLVGITESEVQGLCREITDNVGSVTSP